MDPQAEPGRPGKVKVTVCPVETANPEDKEYFIYADSPNWPLLCRNKRKWESPQQTAPPILFFRLRNKSQVRCP